MCAMLWDLYWAMVDQYGFDSDIYQGNGGNNLAMQLVIDGIKLQPCAPGFVDVRDAILLADQVNSGGANQCLIWEVFARRGLGYSADQGQSTSRSDGVSAFDLPPTCLEILYMEKKTETLAVGLGESLRYRFAIKNQKAATVTQVVLRDTLPDPLIYVQGSATHPATVTGNMVTIVLDSIESGKEIVVEFDVTVPAQATPSSFIFEDDMEGNTSSYLPSASAGSDGWRLDTLNPRSGTNAWFVPNEGATNDQNLTFALSPISTSSVLTFWHEYRTEAGYDGGVIEILPTQSGGNWIDLEPFILSNGYNLSLATNNPLGDVSAFSGASGGYIKTTVDLSAFLNQQLFIRFRFVSDDNTNVEGWWVDDIRIGQEVEFLNTACVNAAQGDVYCNQQDFPTLILENASTNIEKDVHGLFFDLLPNPADRQVVVVWDATLSGPVTLCLRNMVGQELWRQSVDPGNSQHRIDLSQIPAGVYVIEMTEEAGFGAKKLVVE